MQPIHIFVPATIGNVGPGFDVLGLAFEGLGDTISFHFSTEPAKILEVSGQDADDIPLNPQKNCAVIAAQSYMRRANKSHNPQITFSRQLPISGGLGSSAAASVAGAFAAASFVGDLKGNLAASPPDIITRIFESALDGEEAVSGRHLDNIAPCLLGGLCLARSISPVDAIQLPILGEWWISIVAPNLKLNTKEARAVLPKTISQDLWIRQMASTTGVVAAFATADHSLMQRSLIDLYAEPLRAPLITNFATVKKAALAHGALGCSISGAGPSVFALSSTKLIAESVASAMINAFASIRSQAYIGKVAQTGARIVKRPLL